MTLPTSGTIGMDDIWNEWDKVYAPNAAMGLNVWGPRYGVNTPDIGLDDFYGKSVIKPQMSWVDDDGDPHTTTGQDFATDDNRTNCYWTCDFQFLGLPASPTTIGVNFNITAFNVSWDRGTSGIDVHMQLDYKIGGGAWNYYKSCDLTTSGNYGWTSGVISGNYTEAQLNGWQFRFFFQATGAWNGTEYFYCSNLRFGVQSISKVNYYSNFTGGSLFDFQGPEFQAGYGLYSTVYFVSP